MNGNLGLGLAMGLVFTLGANTALADSLTPIAPYAGPGATASGTSLIGINNAGWTTGNIVLSDGDSLGYLRDPSGGYTTFSVGPLTYGRAISNTNTVVGFTQSVITLMNSGFSYSPATSTTPASTTILLNPSNRAPLQGIAQGVNDAGAIVGNYNTQYRGRTVRQGFILAGSTLTQIATPGDPYANTNARGIENNGTVVGWNVNDETGLQQGFVLSGGTFQTVVDPNGLTGSGTILEAVNNNGLALGSWSDSEGNSHGFEYDIATKTSTEIVVPGATTVTTWGINDENQFVVTSDVGNFIYTMGGAAAPDGSTVFDPVAGADLPAGVNQFAFNVVPGVDYFIDPRFASGFEYLAGTGPEFASVTAPAGAGLPTTFQLWLWSSATNAWVFDTDIVGGVTFAFAAPVGEFELRGIPQSAGATSANFITGLTFAGTGTFDGFQDVLGVPEPLSWAMLVVGVSAVGAALRRGRVRVTA